MEKNQIKKQNQSQDLIDALFDIVDMESKIRIAQIEQDVKERSSRERVNAPPTFEERIFLQCQ
jgi:hypothetical protein